MIDCAGKQRILSNSSLKKSKLDFLNQKKLILMKKYASRRKSTLLLQAFSKWYRVAKKLQNAEKSSKIIILKKNQAAQKLESLKFQGQLAKLRGQFDDLKRIDSQRKIESSEQLSLLRKRIQSLETHNKSLARKQRSAIRINEELKYNFEQSRLKAFK